MILHFALLLFEEIEKVQTTGRIPSKEQKYADIYREKPIRISQKVLVPIREHPKVRVFIILAILTFYYRLLYAS